MIKIDLPELPLVASLDLKTPNPCARVYESEPWTIPPFVGEETFAGYPTGAFDVVDSLLGLPDFIGHYRQIVVPYDILQLHRFAFQDDSPLAVLEPMQVAPHTAWGNLNSLHCYTLKSAPIGESATIVITSRMRLGRADTFYNFTLDISAFGDASILSATAGDFNFTPTGSTPRTGNFTQTGSTLTLYGDRDYATLAGSEVQIFLATEVAVPDPKSIVLTFNLSDRGISFLDNLDYLGVSCLPTQDIRYPQDFEFIWNDETLSATTFLPYSLAGGLETQSVQENSAPTTSDIRSITYLSSL